jgi:hypothetical protein
MHASTQPLVPLPCLPRGSQSCGRQITGVLRLCCLLGLSFATRLQVSCFVGLSFAPTATRHGSPASSDFHLLPLQQGCGPLRTLKPDENADKVVHHLDEEKIPQYSESNNSVKGSLESFSYRLSQLSTLLSQTAADHSHHRQQHIIIPPIQSSKSVRYSYYPWKNHVP